MDNGKVWIFENGTEAKGKIGTYTGGQDIVVKTKPNDMIYKTIVRGCSNFNELLELYLYVNASTTKPSFFESDPTTSWTLDMNKVVQYRIPYLADQGAAWNPGVHLRPKNGGLWPPFITYLNETRIIQFFPNSFWFKGNTYSLELVVTNPVIPWNEWRTYDLTAKVNDNAAVGQTSSNALQFLD
jgi:hypothetical protein